VKAFILDRYGSADGVRAGDMPDPEVREDDVLVRVHAAGVNLLDSKIRKVGTFAIQLAKHVGATVATTTSTANVDLARSLEAEVVIDYKKEDFSHVLSDYDVVLNSLDKVTLEKSLRVLKPGGQLISISGPPDAAFARDIGASWLLRTIVLALTTGLERKHGTARRITRFSL